MLFTILIAVVFVSIAGLIYFLVFPEPKIGQTKTQKNISEKLRKTQPIDSIRKTLNSDEQKILKVLENHEGKYLMKIVTRLILAILFTMTACTSTSSQSDECVANNDILGKLEGVIPYDEFSLSFNTSEEGSSLTLWVLDPNLNAHYLDGFDELLPRALLQITSVIHQLNVTVGTQANPCRRNDISRYHKITIGRR